MEKGFIIILHPSSSFRNLEPAKGLWRANINTYEDPCQDWLDLINKKLTSPNYPEFYDPNTVCKWNLTTDKGYYISLDFEIVFVSVK